MGLHTDGFDERWRSEKKQYIVCPGCGWEYTVNNDGRIRRHTRPVEGRLGAKEGCPYSGWHIEDVDANNSE